MQASLAAKLSASQLIDQEETLLPPPPSAAASPPPGAARGDDLGLPSHLWSALEQRWGASGGPAGGAPPPAAEGDAGAPPLLGAGNDGNSE